MYRPLNLLAAAVITVSASVATAQAQQDAAATANAAAPAATTTAAAASTTPAGKLYDAITPSLVAVQYTWENELQRRELTGTGVVVSADGLIAAPITLFEIRAIPDEQIKDVKILVPTPGAEPDEIDATFIGRDERSGLAFLRPKDNGHKWNPVTFVDATPDVGGTVYSVGLMPKAAGYKSYLTQGVVSAQLRGETPLVMVSGGLAAGGSPALLPDGRAVGIVVGQASDQVFLNDQRNPLGGLTNPPIFFIPAKEFVFSFSDLPTPGTPQKLPWMGVSQLTGLKKDVAEYYGLKGQPAVQVGDVIPAGPAEKGGLKRGAVIVKMNGQPLERGDDPDEIAQIMQKKLLRMKIGQDVTFSVLPGPNQPAQDVKVSLGERPKTVNLAKRAWEEDLGFGARDLVFSDTYQRRLPQDTKGVVVTIIKPQGSAAAARLQRDDLITEINGKAIANIDEFKQEYAALRKDKPKDAVVLVVLREGNNQVIRVEPPQ
jgi:serine protease Do